MSITINKTISIDFNNGLNESLLYQEIQESNITRNIDNVGRNGDNCSIVFNGDDALSTSDSDILDTIINEHDGTKNILEPPVQNVQVMPLNDGYEEAPFDIFSRFLVHDGARPLSTDTYITGRGDNRALNYTDIGGGQDIFFYHKIGDDVKQTLYIDFNMEEISCYIYNGWVYWKDCAGDSITLEIVNEVTPITTDQVDTNYNLYGGYLIIPAAGNGTIDIDPTNVYPIKCLVSQKTGLKSPGYWNMDWNNETYQWENITAVPDGTGDYNMFSEEKILDRFVNHLNMVGSHKTFLHIKDTAQFGPGLRMKFHIHCNGDDHEFMVGVNLFLYRSKTTGTQ